MVRLCLHGNKVRIWYHSPKRIVGDVIKEVAVYLVVATWREYCSEDATSHCRQDKEKRSHRECGFSDTSKWTECAYSAAVRMYDHSLWEMVMYGIFERRRRQMIDYIQRWPQ